jgi:hypothetical protein
MSATWRAARRAAGTLVSLFRDAAYWQRRLTVLRFAPDRYISNPDRPADTYAEFLARTHGPLLHEPTARARSSGRRVG